MLRKTFFITTVTLILLSITMLCLLPNPIDDDTSPPIANHLIPLDVIENVRLFDGRIFGPPTHLRIEQGYITKIGNHITTSPDENSFDAKSKFALPGFIDAHTHTYGKALSESLNFGVTATLDMATHINQLVSMRENRDAVSSTNQADLFSAGMPATSEGGHGTQFGMLIEPLSQADQAIEWVDKRISEGSDYIKLIYLPYQNNFSSIDLDTASAVIKAAHSRGLLAIAHVSSQQAAIELLNANIDGFVHTFADSPITDAFIQQAKEQSVFVIPTLAVIASADGQSLGAELLDNTNISKFASARQINTLKQDFGHANDHFNLERALNNVQKMHLAGIEILAGSDAPNPGVTPGISIHHEMLLLVQAGLTPLDAIRAATSIPAQKFKLAKRGEIQIGFRADLVLFEQSPLLNIEHTQNFVTLIKNGYAVTRSSATGITKASRLEQKNLGDFNQSLETEGTLTWTTTHDGMMGGNSSANISQQKRAENSADGVMRVETTIDEGFPYPWAGAYLSGEEDSVFDISHYQQIRFEIRGTPNTYRVMFFTPDSIASPPTVTIEVSHEWQTKILTFNKFDGFDAKRFTGIAVVAGPQTGHFEFSLDNISFMH